MVRLPRHAGAVLLVLACAPIGACGSDESSPAREPSGVSASATVSTAPAASAQTIADARRAVDGDEYARGLAIAKSLSAGEARSIRQRIANRLAERALAALDAGERGRAREFVIEAKDYPSTEQTRFARATYDAAKAQEAEERRRNAEQQRLDEAMRQAGSMRPPPAMRMMPPPSMRMTP